MHKLLHDIRCWIFEAYLLRLPRLVPKGTDEEFAAIVSAKTYIFVLRLRNLGWSEKQVLDRIFGDDD